jgi:2-polyprenyl-3-methyl-5-hydroxy-6-metoxy-1,4-benzoquinol methylase
MITSCSVCGGQALTPTITYGPIPLCDAYATDETAAKAVNKFEVNTVTCSACTHAELSVKPPEEQIYANYKYFSSNSPDLDAHFTDYAAWIVDRLKLDTGAVHMDVGCNDGLLLDKTKAVGFKPMGIDPSPAALNAQRKGYQVYQAYMNGALIDAQNLDGVADVITCNNMMANVRDLMGFGKCLFKMLKPGGAVIVETLHYPLVLRNSVYEMINHEHYHYFSISSIGRFFELLGLELVSVDHVATKGGNMRCIARRPGSTKVQPQINPTLADAEAKTDVKGFLDTLEETRAALATVVNDARKRGPVAGFGSFAGSTILTYLMGLNGKIDFLVDDSPARHGMRAPGTGIPVISPADYYRRNPAATIIFAWRFGRQITDKHHSNLPPSHIFIMANTGKAA